MQEEVNVATGGTFGRWSRVIVNESVNVAPAARTKVACSGSSVASTSSDPRSGLFRPAVAGEIRRLRVGGVDVPQVVPAGADRGEHRAGALTMSLSASATQSGL